MIYIIQWSLAATEHMVFLAYVLRCFTSDLIPIVLILPFLQSDRIW